MELIYSAQKSGFDPQKRYRNPEHFDRPETGVTGVIVVGEWPKVVDAYESVGVEVVELEAGPRRVLVVADQTALDQEELIGKLRAESGAIRVLIESAEGLIPLEHPESGELPIRLFDALSGIHQGIAGIKAERDSLTAENESLRGEVAGLKAAASKSVNESAEIEALKAALDTAKVSYRANASKEALQKQVAELAGF
ncbi:hypothetical protein [Pseudomonas kulmbachensis]|uniref:hypothetical protein n=1 Tax=Pseudomonas kulmbachensis TaxID=3043408 RepID=UPI002AAF6D66|nr:hypothetical protein [Pseudomonas sp. V3/3/4/13]